MRAFIALTGVKPVGEALRPRRHRPLRPDPLDVLADYVAGRIRSEVAWTGSRRRTLSCHGTPTSYRTRSGSSVRSPRPPARAPQGDPVPAVPPEAPGRRDRRPLRPGRGARGDADLRGPGRPALRPGALHRRDVLRASRAARPLELRPDRGERRRPHDRHREAGVQAASTGTSCSTRATPGPTSRRPWPSPTRRPSASPRSPPRRSSRLPRGRRGRAGDAELDLAVRERSSSEILLFA